MIAEFVMRGRWQAVLGATLFALFALILPPVVIISTAVVGLVTLRLGARPSAEVLLLSALVLGVVGHVLLGNPAFAVVSLLIWLPIWVLGLVLRHSLSLSLTVQVAMALGLIPLVLEWLYITSPDGWLELLAPLKDSLEKSQVLGPEQGAEVMAWLARWLTGFMAGGIFLQTVLGLFLARSWQARLYNPGGFRAEFVSLRVFKPVVFAAALCLLLLFLGDATQWSAVRVAAVVLMVLFFLQGLAVMHSLLGKAKGGEVWLIGLYALMLFALPYVSMAMAATGFVDAWWNLRGVGRKARPDDAGNAGEDD